MRWLGRSFIAVVVALASACADGSMTGPDQSYPPLEARSSAAEVANAPRDGALAVELGACTNLAAPAGSARVARLYAQGVQIYRWNGSRWAFAGPEAVLTADAEGRSTVGIHYGGPTWESVSGGKVVGAVLDRCTPDANAIPWLSLQATADEGPGIFRRTIFIQRVNTVGGKEPPHVGGFEGEEARVSYTAEYLFYRAK